MHGPNGQDYENHNVFEIIQPQARIVLRHVSKPVFRMDMTLEEQGPASTLLRWEMVFESKGVRDAVAAVAGQGNEQNFDRLTAVLMEIHHGQIRDNSGGEGVAPRGNPAPGT